MMKQYHIYVFTHNECIPCAKLKAHVANLPEPQQQELTFVPLKAPNGLKTALAEELKVEKAPTLVVCHEDLMCSLDNDGEEWCDSTESPVERFIGAKDIIAHLPSTLDAYTYANPE